MVKKIFLLSSLLVGFWSHSQFHELGAMLAGSNYIGDVGSDRYISPSNIAMGTSLDTDEEKRLSKIGLVVRINDKIQRLINLVVKNNREAQNEPTIDAFKDLACYGIIAQIVEAGKWGK